METIQEQIPTHQLQDQIPSTPTPQLQDKTKRRNWIVEMGSIHAQVQYARITRGKKTTKNAKKSSNVARQVAALDRPAKDHVCNMCF